MITQKAIDRFEKKIIKPKDTKCWLWTDKPTVKGYGRFFYNKRCIGINMMSWMIYKGKIPKGKLVIRTCNNKLCVNPDHLYLSTITEYRLRLSKKKKSTSRISSWKEKIKCRLASWGL